MSTLWHRPATPTAAPNRAGWSRKRIFGLMVAVGCFALLMVLGLVLVIRSDLDQQDAVGSDPGPSNASAPSTGGLARPPASQQLSRAERRDALAAAPMLEVSAEDSRSGDPAASAAPAIAIPDATEVGASRVPSGFPHTPEGAVGQLAALEVVVLQAMSVPRTIEVHTAWADPAAGPVADWPLTEDVRSFLGAARMGPQKDPTTTVTVTPVAAQVKATDGPDWVIGCVLLDIRAVIATEERMAYGYCERMQWNGRQWMIAPGTPPAAAPSTWPGTELAGLAGWRTWQTG